MIVPKLNLIIQLICREYYTDLAAKDPNFNYIPIVFGRNNDQCNAPEVQSRVYTFALIGNVIAGLLSAITSPKLGALSDRYGRRLVLCATTFGVLAGEVITILAAKNPETFPVNWLYLGFALDGLCGSFIAGFALAHSYAADCTPPAKRNVAFGYFHGCLFGGIALGPLVSGYIVRKTGSMLIVFYIALACHLVFIFCLLFIVPESLSKPRQMMARRKYELEQSTNENHKLSYYSKIRAINLLEPLKILWPTGEGTSPALRRNIVLLAAVDTTMFGVSMGAMTVVMVYGKSTFNWDVLEQSIFTSVVNACRVGCLFIILPILVRIFRGSAASNKPQQQKGCDRLDLWLMRVAVLFDTIGYLGYALVRTGPLFILSGCIAAIGGIGSPTLQSALTKHVPHDKVGAVLGASGLLHALARVIAPVVFNGISSATVKIYPQAVFIVLTSIFGVAFLMSLFLRPFIYFQDTRGLVDEGEPRGEVGRL